jgi:hypothetical protein
MIWRDAHWHISLRLDTPIIGMSVYRGANQVLAIAIEGWLNSIEEQKDGHQTNSECRWEEVYSVGDPFSFEGIS